MKIKSWWIVYFTRFYCHCSCSLINKRKSEILLFTPAFFSEPISTVRHFLFQVLLIKNSRKFLEFTLGSNKKIINRSVCKHFLRHLKLIYIQYRFYIYIRWSFDEIPMKHKIVENYSTGIENNLHGNFWHSVILPPIICLFVYLSSKRKLISSQTL